jgi:hypothetical protein
MSPSYDGSSAGPYRGFFFGLFVDDPGWDPRHRMPGFQFLQFYDSTELSTKAGRLWGIDKKLAHIDNSYGKSRRSAEVFFRGSTMAKVVWNVPPLERLTPVVQRRFHNFPDSGGPGARILVNGRESGARFRPGIDEYSFAPTTPLGRTLDDLAFTPQYWTFTHQPHGVYFLPDDRGTSL